MRAPVGRAIFTSASALALLISLANMPASGADEKDAARTVASLAGAPASSLMLRGHAATVPADPEAAEPPAADANGGEDNSAPSKQTLAPANPDGVGQTAEQPALPSVNMALKAALEARWNAKGSLAQRKEREAIAAFYAARDFAPLWWSDGKANAEVKPVMARLERAGDDGLELRALPSRSMRAGSEEEIAAADIALTDAVVAYGRQASGSRIDPHVISPLIGSKPEVADAAIVLAIVAAAGPDAGAELQRFNPPQKAYAALRDKLAELRRARAPAARAPIIPAGPVLSVGMRDPRVPLIRARLSLDGQRSGAPDELIYDTRIATAVADFQKANGLPASGVLTARTIAVLSGGQPSRLEAEILANMERWRWMPRDMGESRIEVNIPNYEAVVIENGRVVQRNRVVVGKEQTPTPVFSNTMQFLIVNPYWNVPQSIIRKEMLPKLAADSGYLRRLGYEVGSRDGRLTVRQPPGERNALGRIKFMFPNDYAVYLHDTPSRALFAADKRAFSHGCVRVDDPFRFAETVLGKGWSEQRVKGLIGGKERYVHLPKPLPVHLEYFTTYVDEAGRLQLRDDIYGYSRRVKAALGLEG
ncbi:L,D-transpeptidase family protein [Methylocapsa aurea]|uniref:L,D-transpeptidase family protein n=1 Tax=Methylocapsa aurea TaxID=663610 RepID=UPI00138E01F3|nr:L,D-transpeptidase family protein [Methylocapsa aurea]